MVNRRKQWLVRELWTDMKMILETCDRPPNLRNIVWALSACDGFILLMLFRTRQRFRRYHIPFVNRTMRLLETALFAIELANDAELGQGVYFMHTVGTVVGGDSKLGDGCILLGNNTIGQAEQPGYPRIGARTIIGAGARVLGKIEVGENCLVGANAVVVGDVPGGKVVLGIPARIAGDNKKNAPARE
jgi:serine O-acetyltransferase